ncbi:unnamed protein product [Acanthoscelides obtectus]|uniref:Uncharacterized protein n=1 Tax=Acanthoscelides obtectus TaxID=200917 RepID=A0A9P0L5V8_ACAOB|nr:unnamed protein product [Acanthoscelides obtectus]CAK1660388.1 hypothetical protein AOBTE_LOCUS22036 [Acanthoscelides obtectus]
MAQYHNLCKFLHILEPCTDPDQLTSTLVNISLASQVAYTFKVGFLYVYNQLHQLLSEIYTCFAKSAWPPSVHGW